jgi:hypothetical protein
MRLLLGGVAGVGSGASSLNGSAIKADIALEALDAACLRFREVVGCGDRLVSSEAMPRGSVGVTALIDKKLSFCVRCGSVFCKVVVWS